jgi:hypothetical protein
MVVNRKTTSRAAYNGQAGLFKGHAETGQGPKQQDHVETDGPLQLNGAQAA